MSPSRSTANATAYILQVALEQPAVDAARGSRRACGRRRRARRARAGRRRGGRRSAASSRRAARTRRRRRRSRRTPARSSARWSRIDLGGVGHTDRLAAARRGRAGRPRGCARRCAPTRTAGPARARRPRAAAAARRPRRPGAARRPRPAGSWPSTSSPLCPSRTTVVRPPTAAATTGVPVACASAATRPNDSL